MITRLIDSVVSAVSPIAGLRRQAARKALARSYQGAEPSRVSSNRHPKNLPADQELMGPFGADRLRAEARRLVRDNSYAWGVVDTIVSSVVGAGIQAQSTYETPEGDDIEDINDLRDKAWSEWSEVADINGRLTLEEIQIIALREMVEAGEVLIRIVNLPSTEYRGISRPIPMALEIIEADRLATDRDTYTMGIDRGDGTRVIRGIKVDESGKPLAYMIYDDHPLQPYAVSRTPKEIPAREIIHLFRQDRVGQTRGVTWFAPALASIRDLGTYLDNELQASAIASCFTAAIKTETPIGDLSNPRTGSGTDKDGNKERYLEPGLVFDLKPGESVEVINPTRPNNAAGEWTKVILRGIAVGTGLSYEVVARDYSQTSYSSSRTSQLEDRRRFRIIQKYLIRHLLQPVWDRFCDAATRTSLNGFPSPIDLLSDRRRFTPVEWQTPKWEWVDPGVEQQTSESGINSFTATYSEVLGAQGLNFRTVFYQRAKENRLLQKLGLQTPEQTQLAISAAQTQGAAETQPATGSGEMMGLSTLQFNRNRKAIAKTLDELSSGAISEAAARVFLSSVGMSETSVQALIDDAKDGSVDTLPAEGVEQTVRQVKRNCGIGSEGFKSGNSCASGDGGGGGGKKIGSGSTGDVYLKDGKAYKSAKLKDGSDSGEGSVYDSIGGTDGISEGKKIGDEIETPYYKNILSVDEIPEQQRKSFGPLVVKNKESLYSAISTLSAEGLDYNDPLQVGINDSKQAKVFDFSNVMKVDVDDAIRENTSHLRTYMEQFGASGEADRLGKVSEIFTDLRSHIRDGLESDWLGDVTQPHLKKLADQLDGSIPTAAYYATNARHVGIKGIAQTEPFDGIKVILSSQGISESDAKQWELTKIFDVNAKAKKVSRKITLPAEVTA